MTIKEKQMHILIGCADARDLSQIQLDAISETTEEFKQQGIDAGMHMIRSVVTFVNSDVVIVIKRTFEYLKRSNSSNVPMKYYVHIQTHGHITEDSNDHYISHVHDLHIVDGSPLN